MIHLLTGPLNSGKTTLLERAVAEWRAKGIVIRGFLSRKAAGGYDLLDLEEGSIHPFLQRSGEDHWQKTGPYFLLPTALRPFGQESIRVRVP